MMKQAVCKGQTGSGFGPPIRLVRVFNVTIRGPWCSCSRDLFMLVDASTCLVMSPVTRWGNNNKRKTSHMKHIKLTLLSLAAIASIIMLAGTPAAASSGGWHYSGWHNGTIQFASNTWKTGITPNFGASPDEANGYFCQLFGFYNCQVTGPSDTWIKTGMYCGSTWVTGPWSRSISVAKCTTGSPYIDTIYVQVASLPYSDFVNL